MAKITSKQTFEMGISVGKNLLQVEHWKEDGCKVGQRIKQENRVYLKNGQQFQIFLKNFRGIPVLVELSINGETQEESVILDPKERLFLERYLSSNNKFKFNTYEMSAGLKKLIESKVELGVVTVKVYTLQSVYADKEVKASSPVIHQVDLNSQPVYGSSGGTGDFSNFNNSTNLKSLVTACSYITSTSDSMGTYGTKCSSKSKGISSPTKLINYSLSMDQNSIDRELAEEVYEEETHTKAEIGAIEKGEYSDQKFEGCPDFRKGRFLESYTIHVYPVSAQLQEETKSSQKIEGAIYCSVCGRKQKSGQKFCPADGTEFGK